MNELAGMLAADDNAKRTKLSMIKSHVVDQTGKALSDQQEKCVLFGPIRFINHRCKTFNAEASS